MIVESYSETPMTAGNRRPPLENWTKGHPLSGRRPDRGCHLVDFFKGIQFLQIFEGVSHNHAMSYMNMTVSIHVYLSDLLF